MLEIVEEVYGEQPSKGQPLAYVGEGRGEGG